MGKRNLMTFVLISLVFFFSQGIAIAYSNLLINGGFEEPQLNYGQWNGNSTSIDGWSSTFGTIEIQNHWADRHPYEGYQWVELDSYANSGMMQNITTTTGKGYVLSLAYSPRRESLPLRMESKYISTISYWILSLPME